MYAEGLGLLLILGALGARIHLPDPVLTPIAFGWAALVAFLYVRMIGTGEYSRYRTFFFLSLAAFFLFQLHLGSGLSQAPAPVCHLSLAAGAFQAGQSQFLAIANNAYFKYGALSLGVLWLGVVLVNGGAFCGWVCFFGGVDDSLSRIFRRPPLTLRLGPRARRFQLGALAFLAVFTLLSMEPIFCKWVCPFKVDAAILNPNSAAFALQVAAYLVVGALFLMVLPLLTGKRTFCSFICPFGAVPPLVAGISPFRAAIDPKLCSNCGRCLKVCPSFAIETGKRPKIGRNCTLCLRCAAECPRGAISATLFGERKSRLPVFVSMLFGGALALFYVPAGLAAALRAALRVLA